MRKFTLATASMLLAASFALAQDERPEPTYDALRAFFGDASVECLITNKDAMRDAGAADFENLRELQRTLRQTRRDGGDASAVETQIEGAKANLAVIKSQYSELAQACVDPGAVQQLVAAEALQDEVRQAVALLAVESTREAPEGFEGQRRSRRGGRGPGR